MDKGKWEYGDLIMFYKLIFDNKKLTKIAFISAQGFFQNKMKVEIFKLNEFNNVDNLKTKIPDDFFLKMKITNYRDFIFEINPKLNYKNIEKYKNNQNLIKYSETYLESLRVNLDYEKDESKNSEIKNKIDQIEDIIDKEKYKLKKLKINLENDININKKYVKNYIGKPISYGEKIFIKHYNSNEYIKIGNKISKCNKISLFGNISSDYDKNSKFEILPSNKVKLIGENIYFDDDFLIIFRKSNLFLDYSKTDISKVEYKNYFNNPYIFDINLINELEESVNNLIFSNIANTWKVLLFKKHDQIFKNKLISCDFIRIIHNETNLLMQGDHDNEENNTEIFLNKFNDKNICNIFEVHSLINKNILLKNNDNLNLSTLVNWSSRASDYIYLKNFHLNKFIRVNDNKLTLINNYKLKNTEKNYEIAKFEFESIYKNNGYWLNNQSYYISLKNINEYLKQDNNNYDYKKYYYDSSHYKYNDLNYNGIYSSLIENIENDKKKKIKITKNKSLKNTFLIYRLDAESVRNILYIRSLIKGLYQFRYMVFEKQSLLNFKKINKINNLLKSLLCFLFDLNESENYNFFNINSEPKLNKQYLFKYFNIMDCLIDILYFINSKQKAYEWIYNKFINNFYNSIRLIIKECRPNELYCSQWLNFFILQSLKPNKDNREAKKTLIELIDNNKIILENRIQKKTIKKFIDSMGLEKKFKYMNILQIIIICNNEPIIKNQREISLNILHNNQKSSKFLLTIYEDNESFICNSYYFKNMNLLLNNLELITKESKNYPYFKYILYFFNLLGDLCTNRNNIAIDILKSIYPLELVLNIIKNNCFNNFKFGKVFIKLVRVLWVDIFPFYKKLKLNYFMKLGEKKSIMNNISNKNKKYKIIFSTIVNFIDNFNKKLEFKKLHLSNIEIELLNEYLILLYKIYIMEIVDINKDKESIECIFILFINIINKLNNNSNLNIDINLLEMSIIFISKIIKCIIIKDFNVFFDNLYYKTYMYINKLKLNTHVKDINEGIVDFISHNFNNKGQLYLEDNYLKELFINLILYKNSYKIISKGIELLFLIDSKLEIFKNIYSNILIIEDCNFLYKNFKKNAKILRKIKESCNIWIFENDDLYLSEFENTINNLFVLLQTDNKTFEENIRKTIINKGDLNDIYFEIMRKNKFEIIEFNQNIIYRLGILQSLIEIFVFIVKYKEISNIDLNSNLMKKYFILLHRIVENNNTNLNYILKYLDDYIIPFLNMTDCLQFFIFFSTISTNISLFCFDNKKIVSLIKIIIKKIIKTDKNNILKSFLLNIFSVIIKNSGDLIRNNQNLICNRIFNKSNKEINYPMSSIFIKELNNKIRLKGFNIKKNNNEDEFEYLDSELCYFLSFIDLMINLSLNKNSFTENFCQNYFKLNSIIEILKIPYLSNLLKLYIIIFLNEVYIDTENSNNFIFYDIINNLIITLVEEFSIFLRNHWNLENKKTTVNKNQYFVSHVFIYSMNDVNKKLLENLLDCFLIFSQKKIIFHKNTDLFLNFNHFINETFNLIQKYRLKDNTLSNKIYNLLLSLKQNNIMHIDIDFYDKLDEIIEFYKEKINNKNKNIDLIDNHSSKLYYFKNTIKEFFESEVFNWQYKNEYNKIISFVINFHNKFNYNDYFSIFFRSLMDFMNPKYGKRKKILIYKSLITLRKFIEKSIDTDKHIIEWDGDEYFQNKEEINKRQNLLIDNNIIDLIIKLINEYNDKEIFDEIMNLNIALLLGGNLNSQNSFYLKLKNDKKNKVLEKIKDRSYIIFYFILENLENYKRNKLENGIFISKINNVLTEEIFIDPYVESGRKIFRFLQLLCEGHNENLQKFLRIQNDNKLLNYDKNINFIKIGTYFFGEIVKNIIPETFKFLNQLINFLNESIQGPCTENQKTIFNSKIIDYCKDLINEFSDNNDFQIKGLNEEEKQNIEDLIINSLKLILSILEANKDIEIIDYISRNLEIEFIIDKLKNSFENYFLRLGYTINEIYTQDLIRKSKIKIFDEELSNSFEIYNLLQILISNNNDNNKYMNFLIKNSNNKADIDVLTEYKKKMIAYNFFKENSISIEINFKNEIYKIIFPMHPTCDYLENKLKNKIILNLKRNTPKDKIIDFLSKKNKIFENMEFRMSFMDSKKMSLLSPKFYLNYSYFNYIFYVILNLYILIVFKKEYLPNNILVDENINQIKSILFYLGIINCILVMIKLILFYLIEGSLVI